jgi:ketosteroid isomerase-like protein
MGPEALIQAAYDAINARDLQALLAVMDRDVEVRSMAIGSRRSGWFRGPAGVAEWWNGFVATYDACTFTLREVHVKGDGAVAGFVARFRIGDEEIEHAAWHAVRARSGRLVLLARFASEDEARAAAG